MLKTENKEIQDLLLKGKFGLEKESLRLQKSGRMAHTPHYAENEHITRDFCENQTEINTSPYPTLEETLAELHECNRILQKEAYLRGEMLWPFSNPGYLRDEEDIPIAQFENEHSVRYREYLKNRYGAHKMTFSGIHYNFSFDDDLLKKEAELEGKTDLKAFKDQFYLELAQKASEYGWLVTVLMAASPIIDSSFWNEGIGSESYFSGHASLRNSEMGYWNSFVPIFNYNSLEDYAASIEKYCEEGLLKEFRELYYPIRLKPKGQYTLDNLRKGIGHIELRMVDLNPMEPDAISLTDAKFLHYFLVWLASLQEEPLTSLNQIEAVANFKRASLYDLNLSFILDRYGNKKSLKDASLEVLERMEKFYSQLEDEALKEEILNNLNFQKEKILNPKEKRYANIVYDLFNQDYLIKASDLAKFNQQQYLEE